MMQASLRANREQEAGKSQGGKLLKSIFILLPFALFEMYIHLHDAVDGELRTRRPNPDSVHDLLTLVYDATTTHVISTCGIILVFAVCYGSYAGAIQLRRWTAVKAIMRAQTVLAQQRAYQALSVVWLSFLGFAIWGYWLVITGH